MYNSLKRNENYEISLKREKYNWNGLKILLSDYKYVLNLFSVILFYNVIAVEKYNRKKNIYTYFLLQKRKNNNSAKR